MTLRLKINLIVSVMMLLFVASFLALAITTQRESVNEEVTAAHRVATQMLNHLVEQHGADRTDMLHFLEGVGRIRSNDITLFDSDHSALYRSPSSPWKRGRDAPAWFASLVAPEPASRTMRLSDGWLFVRSDPSRAELDAWDDFRPLMLTAAELLLAVNVAVFWLVSRAARPFARIVAGLNELEAGRFDVTLPRLRGAEAAAIGAAFNRMVAVLRDKLEAERRIALTERRLSDSRKLTRWIDDRLEQERRSIARELHDELGQSVTAIRSMALSVAQRVGPIDPTAENAARVIAAESSRLYDAMHGLIPRLTPLVLDRLGLEEALADLAERTRLTQPDVQVELHVDLGTHRPTPETALTVFRAAQEGVTNALRHARPGRLEIRLAATETSLQLEVCDDGIGLADEIETGAESHYGLRLLAERAEDLGGRCWLDRFAPGSTPDRGACLRLTLPVRVDATAPMVAA